MDFLHQPLDFPIAVDIREPLTGSNDISPEDQRQAAYEVQVRGHTVYDPRLHVSRDAYVMDGIVRFQGKNLIASNGVVVGEFDANDPTGAPGLHKALLDFNPASRPSMGMRLLQATPTVRTGDERYKKFIPTLREIAALSKDRKWKVGALALGADDDMDIRTTGYNGIPRKCNDNVMARNIKPEKDDWFEHAERNLIYNAARIGVPLKGCTLMVTPLPPCVDCARAIIQVGIKRVIAISAIGEESRWYERAKKAQLMLIEAGVDYTEWRSSDIA